ncbi:hypothetical protein [Halogeometricum limi]|uniref:hypothetical protein n=1 Tax=Halogeometricum limi TaxID=555875 RepID=UPI001587A946|nr:hypothetical protein [Halogeometricum limi]
MSSDGQSSSLGRTECESCGAVLREQLLERFAVRASDDPNDHVHCPACGDEIPVSPRS